MVPRRGQVHRTAGRRAMACALSVILLLFIPRPALAEVTKSGDTTIGNYLTVVGDESDGTLDITSPELFLTGQTILGNTPTGVGAATLSGAGASWENVADFIVGQSGEGALRVDGGATLHSGGAVILGNEEGSLGTLTIDGPLSSFIADDSLRVGYRGDGSLEVINGASLTTPYLYLRGSVSENGVVSRIARATFSGAGTSVEIMGGLYDGARLANASIEVSDGASANSIRTMTIDPTLRGSEIVVRGAGSEWIHWGTLRSLGDHDQGRLHVLDGGYFLTGKVDGILGDIQIEGDGSEWRVYGEFSVMNNHTTTIQVSDGGLLHTGMLDEDTSANIFTSSTIVISDHRSKWIHEGNVTMGVFGRSVFQVENGGSVETMGDAIVSGSLGSQVEITGAGSNWNVGERLFVGNSGDSKIVVSDGGLLRVGFNQPSHDKTAVQLGVISDAVSTVVVDGENSRWQVKGLIEFGSSSYGRVELINGGTLVSSYASTGDAPFGSHVLVKGVGSKWTNRGGIEWGFGQIDIEDGGSLETSTTHHSTTTIGGYLGKVRVSGSGSTWLDHLEVELGGTGSGTLVVENGGTSIFRYLSMMEDSGSSIVVDGEHSLLQADNLRITSGNSVRLSHGGKLAMYNGLSVGEDARLEIDGGQFASLSSPGRGGFIQNDGMIIGHGMLDAAISNNGTIRIADGEQLRIGTDREHFLNHGYVEILGTSGSRSTELIVASYIANDEFNGQAGTMRIANARVRTEREFRNRGELVFPYGATQVFGDVINSGNNAQIVVAGDSRVTFFDDLASEATINVVAGSKITVWGELSGGGNVGGGEVEVLGTLSPSQTIRSMSFGGDLVLPALSEVLIQVGDTSAGTFDRISVDGELWLDARLDLLPIPGFSPSINDRFTFFEIDGMVTGQFAGLPEGAFVERVGGVPLYITYTAGDGNDIGLYTPSPTGLPGDYDYNGTVDQFDYAAWKTQFGLAGSYTADGNGDGYVNAADYAIWRNNLGRTLAGGGSLENGAVPEPSAVALLGLATIAIALRRQSGQK